MDLDDIYICNDSGTVRNDFLGIVTIEGIAPGSDGGTTEWDPAGGGSHYSEVDDQDSDDDTSFVQTPDNNKKDLYGVTSLAFISGSILGIQVSSFARVTLAGSRTFAIVYHDGALATEDESSPFTVNDTDYANFCKVWEQNPETSADFTLNDVNNAEIGVRSIT